MRAIAHFKLVIGLSSTDWTDVQCTKRNIMAFSQLHWHYTTLCSTDKINLNYVTLWTICKVVLDR